MDIADFLIHVHPDLSGDERTKLEDGVGGLEGVVSVHFSPEHHHLMVVAYDPELTDSARILEYVGARGVEATKIGL